jgi:transcriptional regulator with XRE-family HTH domain
MRASQHREPPGPSNGRAVSSTATGLGRGRLEKGFGGWLREAREVRGWSAAHLARECGLTTLTVSRIEREVQTPRALSAMLLIRALGPSESELLELIRPHDDERAMLSRAFGKSVRRHRRSARLSPGQLAERCGVKLTIIVNTELGRIEPGLALIRSLCSTLGVTASELIGHPSVHERCGGETAHSSTAAGRTHVAAGGSYPRPFEPVADALMLAAIDRAERHEQTAGVSWRVIVEHLGFARSGATTRKLRPGLDALVASGAIRRDRRYGGAVWGLTPAGRRQLSGARRTGSSLQLPESPQHRAWREERSTAVAEIEELRGQVRGSLQHASALLASLPGSAAEWFALAQRLGDQCALLANAIYRLHEWAEPDDARADIHARRLANGLA